MQWKKTNPFHSMYDYRIAGFYCEKKYLQITQFFSEEIFAILDYCIHNRRYIEDIWIQKFVLALIFTNTFKITKFAKIKMVVIKFGNLSDPSLSYAILHMYRYTQTHTHRHTHK